MDYDLRMLVQDTIRELEPAPEKHMQIRMCRRVLVERLKQAVRERDAGALQLAAHRLSRLGVKRDQITQMAQDALSPGAQR